MVSQQALNQVVEVLERCVKLRCGLDALSQCCNVNDFVQRIAQHTAPCLPRRHGNVLWHAHAAAACGLCWRLRALVCSFSSALKTSMARLAGLR